MQSVHCWLLLWFAAVALTSVLAVAGSVRAQTVAAPTISQLVPGDEGFTAVWVAPSSVDAASIEQIDLRYILTSATDKSDSEWTILGDVQSGDEFSVVVRDLTNGSSYDVQMRVVTTATGTWSTTSLVTPTEPGRNRNSALAVAVNVPLAGVLGSASDVDYFRFDVTENLDMYVYTDGSVDTAGALYDSSGTRITNNDVGGLAHNGDSFVLLSKLSPGRWFIRVDSDTGSTGDYTLRIRTVLDHSTADPARPLEIGVPAVGLLVASDIGGDYISDVDYYTFDVETAGFYSAWTSDYPTDAPIGYVAHERDVITSNPKGVLYDSTLEELARNDDSGIAAEPLQVAMRAYLEPGTYLIELSDANLSDELDISGIYSISVASSPEPGNSLVTAAELGFRSVRGGVLSQADEVDYFQFELVQRRRVLIGAVGSSYPLQAQLLDDTGSVISLTTRTMFEGGQSDTSIAADLEAGDYYLTVQSSSPAENLDYFVYLQPDVPYEQLLLECPESEIENADDPLVGCQWHFKNTGQFGGVAGEDINIGDVWETNMGAGVNIAIVDSGLDFLHEDLLDNVIVAKNHSYNPSVDVNSEPQSHGTPIAGLIAARHNDVGGRGVAPLAKIYGFNLLSSILTDSNMADAAARERVDTSISNNSWGNARNIGANHAPEVWELAVESGLEDGAGGKGIVYVFAAANGHESGFWAGLDEITNFYAVITVCGVQSQGVRASYSENGPNLWVCAPTSGTRGVHRPLTTTDAGNRYTGIAGGTSSAAPLVSGVAALVRSENDALTWRDVKLVLAASARKNDSGDTGWAEGAPEYRSDDSNYEFNHQYGFGVVDASAAVNLAKDWVNLPPMRTSTTISRDTGIMVPDNSSAATSVTIDTAIDFVEYIEVNVDFDAPRLRHLRLVLTSPSGAESWLTVPAEGLCGGRACSLTEWFRFGSARHLGEDPNGTWTLTISDEKAGSRNAQVREWNIRIYGHLRGPVMPMIQHVQPEDDGLTVAWLPPDDPGAHAIEGYEVRYIRSDAVDKGDGQWTVVSDAGESDAREYTISGLTSNQRYDVQVRAVSEVSGRWSVTARGTVGASNGEPFFPEGELTQRSTVEQTATGSHVGAPVAARDSDGDALVYSLSGTDATEFDIVPSTGQILTKSVLDFETRTRYDVDVEVSDGKDDDGTTDTATDRVITVLIDVTDADLPLTIVGDSQLTFPENSDGIVATYTTSPLDDILAAADWSLSGTDMSLFSIDSAGELSFVAPPDFEATRGNVYEVTVTAMHAAKSDSLDVVVTVTDVNDPPEFTVSVASVSFGEGGAGPVTRFEASDADGDDVSWNLGGDDQALFAMVEGVISFVDPPDYETPADLDADNKYDISVEVSDGELTSAAALAVNVQNRNDAGTVTLSSSQPRVGSAITANIDDQDGIVGSVSWSWERSSDLINWVPIDDADSAQYLPTDDDIGQYLRAHADYYDNLDPLSARSAVATTSERTLASEENTYRVTGVVVTPGDAQLAVAWTAVTGASGYKVQWKSGDEDYDTGDRQATVTPGSTTTYTISGRSNGTEYTVRVIATRTGDNDGPPSDEVKGTPTASRERGQNQCPGDSGERVVLVGSGNIHQAGESDFWRVELDPWRIYVIEVLGSDGGSDLVGEANPGGLTLLDPHLYGVWSGDRSELIRRAGTHRPARVTITRADDSSGFHQFEVRSFGGNTGTYQIKIRVNNICVMSDGKPVYSFAGGPDGYTSDRPADPSTGDTFHLRPRPSEYTSRSFIGFLGDNWDWYWGRVPDEDWFAIEGVSEDYQYTINVETIDDLPVKHQATRLKIRALYDSNGIEIQGTSGTSSGKKVSLTFQPDNTGLLYVSVGSDPADRTGVYRITISAKNLQESSS